jgi:hypothetical protein
VDDSLFSFSLARMLRKRFEVAEAPWDEILDGSLCAFLSLNSPRAISEFSSIFDQYKLLWLRWPPGIHQMGKYGEILVTISLLKSLRMLLRGKKLGSKSSNSE